MLEIARNSDSVEELERALKMFKCHKDSDIEEFLHNKAIDFMDRGICRVYLILNEEEFDKQNIKIEAYFTLSLRALKFEGEVSKTTRKKLTGFKDRELMEFVLIGQLGKYIEEKQAGEICKSKIKLSEILDYIFEVINSVNELVPCNVALIECSEAIHNKGLYQNEGFSLLQADNDFYQYYKKIHRN